MSYSKNYEGYADPTAADAISSADREKKEREMSELNHWAITTMRSVADSAGFEIVGRITLKHKRTGKIFK